jgi:hypothetical protein
MAASRRMKNGHRYVWHLASKRNNGGVAASQLSAGNNHNVA